MAFDNNLPFLITYYFVYGLINSQDTLLASAAVNGTLYRYDFDSAQWLFSPLPNPRWFIVNMVTDNGVLHGITNSQIILRSENNGVLWRTDSRDLKSSYPAIGAPPPQFLYTGSTWDYAVTNVSGGTWVKERNWGAAGATWSQGQDFQEILRANAIIEAGGSLFLGTDVGIYTLKIDQ